MDVAAVYRQGELQNVATTMVSYGYFGDLLKTSERWRKLGPSRYVVSGILQVLRNRSYEGQLKVLTPANPLAQPYDINTCCQNCTICDKAAVSPPAPGEWLHVSTVFSTCRCVKRSLHSEKFLGVVQSSA